MVSAIAALCSPASLHRYDRGQTPSHINSPGRNPRLVDVRYDPLRTKPRRVNRHTQRNEY